jgi:hypothetical protein
MIFRALMLVLSLVAALPAIAADSQTRFALRGVGQATCEQFLKALEARQENVLLAIGWIDGYLSGINQASPQTFDIAPWQNSDALLGVLKHNCEQNREQRFFTVVVYMVNFLKDSRIKEAGKRIVVGEGEQKLAIYESVMKEVQQKLVAKKLLDGTPDGQYGPKTKAALEQFQKSQSLEANGLPDQQTLWRLLAPQPKG